MQGQILLKVCEYVCLFEWGRGLTLFVFNFLKVYHFYIYRLHYALQKCVMNLKKNYFFLSP